ncbi:MAG: hypothetical protein JSC189_000052 [Candidatus Tokpelaia sp. JSC189]|nr:MAG: hypothetical protein JSC189_000052 [Candidatus Tokpelaia sp. JSC189]
MVGIAFHTACAGYLRAAKSAGIALSPVLLLKTHLPWWPEPDALSRPDHDIGVLAPSFIKTQHNRHKPHTFKFYTVTGIFIKNCK